VLAEHFDQNGNFDSTCARAAVVFGKQQPERASRVGKFSPEILAPTLSSAIFSWSA